MKTLYIPLDDMKNILAKPEMLKRMFHEYDKGNGGCISHEEIFNLYTDLPVSNPSCNGVDCLNCVWESKNIDKYINNLDEYTFKIHDDKMHEQKK